MSFKNLLQIDKILNLECFSGALKPILAEIARDVLDTQRELIKNGKSSLSMDEIVAEISKKYENFKKLSFQSVINATGVVMHTNLGRSVIDDEILNRAKETIISYSNLEFNLDSGERGNRYDYISRLLATLFGSEDALVVNNNSSAVFLVLNTFAKDGECVVSRGELIEIGGSFRIPDVMSSAGTTLKEIGTTNKTKIVDYENAINERTKMLFKAHRSNFDMVGFTQDVSSDKIANLAKKACVISYYDLGSGYVNGLNFNLDKDELSISETIKSGVDILSFSGDKLFGSVQCGIILGKRELIKKLRKNQLLRMLRVDKVILSILSESVKAYLNKEVELITTINLINKSVDELENLANFINKNLKTPLKIAYTKTFVGGGSLPNKSLPSVALVVGKNAMRLQRKFREKNVIGRIENDKFLLDLRSILKKDVNKLINIINEIVNE